MGDSMGNDRIRFKCINGVWVGKSSLNSCLVVFDRRVDCNCRLPGSLVLQQMDKAIKKISGCLIKINNNFYWRLRSALGGLSISWQKFFKQYKRR